MSSSPADAPALIRMLAAVPVELCRRPDPARGGWEAALAEGNDRALAAARHHVADRAPALDSLLDAPWASPPRILAGGAALLAGVDIGDLADRVLTDQHLPPGRVFVDASGDGETSSVEMDDLEFMVVRPRATAVAELITGGGSMVVVGVEEHDARLNRAVEDLDRVLGLTCRVDIEWVGHRGLSVAADGFARVLVAVEGDVLAEARAPMMPADQDDPMPANLALRAGDAAHVPPGWGHRLVPADGTALVAAIVLPRLTAKGLALQMVDDLLFWPLFRSDVPLDRHAPHASYAGSVYEGPGLAQSLGGIVDDAMVTRVLARHLARLGARWTAGVCASVEVVDDMRPGTRLRAPLPGGILVGLDAEPDRAVVFAARRRLEMEASAAAALGHLADGADHAVSELAAFAPDDVADASAWSLELARNLVQVALAEVAP